MALDLGIGNNRFTGTGIPDDVFGNDGNDTLRGLGGNDSLDGGNGNDRIEGGSDHDTLSGAGGHDTIDGGSGRDSIRGGSGRDAIRGGSGNDIVDGGSDNDTVDGDSGDDLLLGGGGHDSLNGGAGDDSIEGGDGNDTIDGHSGGDTLNGGSGNDLLRPSSGDDVIDGGQGNDTLNGGAGDDIITGGQGNDIIDGGGGRDCAVFAGVRASYSIRASGGVIVVTDVNLADGDEGTDRLIGVERLEFRGEAPVAIDGLAATNQDTTIDGVLTATDVTDPPASLSYHVVAGPMHGAVTLGVGGRFSYTPAPGYTGPDSFSFRAVDPSSHASDLATVSIDVAALPAVSPGPEFRINSFTGGDQYQDPARGDFAVAGLADGGFVASWTSSSNQDGSGLGAYGQRFDAAGNPVGGEFRINTITEGDQELPSVAALEGGGFVASWTTYSIGLTSISVHAQRYDAAGNPVGDEFQVNTETSGEPKDPSIAGLAGGGFVAAWLSSLQDGSGYGVYGQRYDAGGNRVGEEFRINTEVTGSQIYPSLAALDGGGFVATWSSLGQDGDDYGVYGQRYDAVGNPVGDELHISTETARRQWYSSVAALDGGGFVVVWVSDGQDGSGDGIYGQRFDAAGDRVGDEFRINSVIELSQMLPSVAGLDGGGFVATWTSNNHDGSGRGIYGQRYDANGDPVESEFLVNTYTLSHQWFSSIASLDGGDFVVTWQSYGQDGNGDGIYGKVYSPIFGAGKNLAGGAGNDAFIGGPANDAFNGAGGSDTASGGTGNDTLSGGGGVDSLSGGGGNDAFVFGGQAGDTPATIGGDRITDFEGAGSAIGSFSPTHELIVLSRTTYGALGGAGGTIASPVALASATEFEANASGAATTPQARLVFNTATGVLAYDADGNGAGASVAIVTLVGVANLAAGDIGVFG